MDLTKCELCPRMCGVNRAIGQKGYCKTSCDLLVARCDLHMWEEPCISGEEGSGTVFFSGCSVGCVYCQNRKISGGERGKVMTTEELANEFLKLQERGANNINLVTPTHYVLHIIEALKIAKSKGLNIPIVYNTSGYERVETLKLLKDYVDIYLTDFKYIDKEIAKKYSNAEDYYEYAEKALDEMVKQQPRPILDENGIIKKGVIVRHLVLPGCIVDSKDILYYLYETYNDRIILSIMNQFTPLDLDRYPEINRKVNEEEYNEIIDWALELGIEQAYIQEGDTASESFIPEF